MEYFAFDRTSIEWINQLKSINEFFLHRIRQEANRPGGTEDWQKVSQEAQSWFSSLTEEERHVLQTY